MTSVFRWSIICVLMSFMAMHAQVFAEPSKAKPGSSLVLDEVSIIGNTELPNVGFELPWKLPTVQKREDSQPLPELDGMLVPIDPIRHRKDVIFSQSLELEVPNYKVK